MQVKLVDIGKRFDRHFVFRGVSDTFQSGDRIAVLGGNGSGKSTLLKLVSGALTASEGKIIATQNERTLSVDEYMRTVAFAGPYTEVIEEFTLREWLSFYSQFKSWRNGLTNEDIISLSGLAHAADKAIANFSSGMRQRVRLVTAIMTESPVLLLDEPTSNLDAKAMDWFHDLLSRNLDDRILLVGSNHQPQEIALCTRELNLTP